MSLTMPKQFWVVFSTQSLGWEDPLEKEMVTHSSTLAWKIPWTEEPGRLQSMGRKESERTERLHFHFSLSALQVLGISLIRKADILLKRIIVIFSYLLVSSKVQHNRASLVTQTVKNLPAMQEIWVRSLDLKDPVEKGIANHTSILTWRNPWTEEPGGLQSVGLQRVGQDRVTNSFGFTFIA